MPNRLRLAIVGDFNAQALSHAETGAALEHVGSRLGLEIAADWVATADLASQCEARLSGYDGLWIAPGGPYRSMDGALNAIRYGREKGVPLLATCGGCQHVVIEFARNVLGIVDAQHAEYDPYASTLIVTPLSCSLAGRAMTVLIEPGSAVAEAYAATEVTEQYYCNFGINPDYEERLQAGGLRIVGRDADREPRVLWLPGHPFFVATLFVPQVASTPDRPHPLIAAWVRAAADHGRGGPRASDAVAFSA